MRPSPRSGGSGASLVRGLIAAVWLSLAWTAIADRVYFKNTREIIEGIIQEEYPTRIRFLHQGQVIIIPRSRIERLERESTPENIEAMLKEVETAVAQGEADLAQRLLEKIKELTAVDPARFEPAVKAAEEKIARVRAEGQQAARRIQAEENLEQARAHFDRIENERGVQFLLAALRIDPDFEEAHQAMGRYMRQNYPPPLSMAVDYFSDMVDPKKLPPDHPIVDLLPRLFTELRQRLQDAGEPDAMAFNTRRLEKVTQAFELHPEWAAKASETEKALINLGAGGIIRRQVVEDLRNGDFAAGLRRLEAWKSPEQDPEAARLYARAWVGLEDLAKARSALETLRGRTADEDWVTRNINAVELFETAREHRAQGRHQDARQLLQRLFDLREGLLPELAGQVAAGKVGYDLAQLQSLEAAGDAAGAAALAVQINAYAPERDARRQAQQAFQRLAPQIAYRLNLLWRVDGVEIPLHDESFNLVREAFAKNYNLRFNAESPFELNVQVDHGTRGRSGSRLLEAAQQPNAWELDQFNPDDSVNEMRVRIAVATPGEDRPFYEVETRNPGRADNTVLARTEAGMTIYLDITQLNMVDNFWEADFTRYLPRELSSLGSRLRLRER